MLTPAVVLSTQLSDHVHTQPVTQALRDLARVANRQHLTLADVATRLAAIPAPLSIDQIRAALTASGSAPLNITQLIPSTPTPTSGTSVTTGTHADRLALPTGGLALGDLYIESDRVAVYEWTALGWVLLGNFYAPMDVTLAPNTKPADLAGADTGFYVWATDFARAYKWTGAAWAEDNHNPSRYQIGHFAVAPDQNGWFLCDGSVVSRSTTTGGVTNFTTPDLLTANRFLRSATPAGGTGDTSTHHHSVAPPTVATGTPSTTISFHDGTGAALAAGRDDHVHNVVQAAFNSADTQALPPWYDALPYVRL